MTQNQIRYLQVLEEARANKAREEENLRSNVAKEQENVRSNLARESETNRSNLENERMAREKWDYEKYGGGKGGTSVGNTIRTIKAVTNDVAKVVGNLVPTSSDQEHEVLKNVDDDRAQFVKDSLEAKSISELQGAKKKNEEVAATHSGTGNYYEKAAEQNIKVINDLIDEKKGRIRSKSVLDNKNSDRVI